MYSSHICCADGSYILSGGRHEACSGAYAFLFWNRNDASFVHSGDTVDADLYYRVSDFGILSVLLLDCKGKLQKEPFSEDVCTEEGEKKKLTE